MSDLKILQMLAERIERDARALAWGDYYKNHDRETWDRPDVAYPDWYDPDEYRQKVLDKLFGDETK